MHSFTDVVSCPFPDQRLSTNSFVTAQLIAIRLLIGLFEAGFYPTAIFYLSTFYTRFDLAVRIALFYGQYAVAGAFSGAIGKCTTNTVVASLLTHNSIWSIPARRRFVQLAISLHHRGSTHLLYRHHLLDLVADGPWLSMVPHSRTASIQRHPDTDRWSSLRATPIRQGWP